MNLPAVLDVALGLIVLYLLLSTVCSFAVEVLAAWFWWRKTLLYKTIGRLLTGKSDCKAPKMFLIPRVSTDHPTDVLTRFWNHPLAVSLSPDKKLPSYVEPSTFAAIVIDLAVPGATTGTLPGTSEGLDRVISLAATAADEEPWQSRQGVLATGDVRPSREGVPATKAEEPIATKDLKQSREIIPTTQDLRPLREGILTAFRACGLNRPLVQTSAPVDDLRRGIEKWYNEAMERSTGEYKRRAQCWLMATGIILAAAFNADTIRTAYVLSTNDSLRNTTATYAATLATGTNGVTAASSNALNLAETNGIAVAKLKANLIEQLKELQQLQRLGFPLGWKGEEDPGLDFTPYDRLGPWKKWLVKIAGLLATALAISLGAPFWFDLLNKLVSLRGSGNRIPTNEPATAKAKAGADGALPTPPPNPLAGAPMAVAPPSPADFGIDLADARQGFHGRKAYWLAEAALLAYSPKASAQAAVEQWGLELVHFFDKAQACQGFLAVAKDKRIALLAFRGTEKKLEDWQADAEFKLVASPTGVGQTHEGFTNELKDVHDELVTKLKEQLKPDTLLYLTGHSLGAALATLMAARLAADKSCGVHCVHTFGSPRVGDRDFAKNYELALGHCTYRVVNAEDLVTRVPPRIIPNTDYHYDHVGRVVFFDSDGRMQLSAGFWDRFLNTLINAVQDFRNELKKPIGDHSMELYVRLLKRVI